MGGDRSEETWKYKALRVHDRLQAVGLADPIEGEWPELPRTADALLAMIAADFDALAAAGLSRSGRLALAVEEPGPAGVEAALDAALEVLEHNPLPDKEWGAVRGVVGDDLLATLTGTSLVSMRRYAAGTRTTPDDVAARLHFVALVNADLLGSYNEVGIRRWWQRARSQLDGQSPIEALGKDWDPDASTAATSVRALAGSLVGAGAAT